MKRYTWDEVKSTKGTFQAVSYPTTSFYSDGNGNVIWRIFSAQPEIAASSWSAYKYIKLASIVAFCVENGKIVPVKKKTSNKKEKQVRSFSLGNVKPRTVKAQEMKCGQFAIVHSENQKGALIYKISRGSYEILANGESIPDCWSEDAGKHIDVEIIQPGTTINITV